jgi:hypothetical protein
MEVSTTASTTIGTTPLRNPIDPPRNSELKVHADPGNVEIMPLMNVLTARLPNLIVVPVYNCVDEPETIRPHPSASAGTIHGIATNISFLIFEKSETDTSGALRRAASARSGAIPTIIPTLIS